MMHGGAPAPPRRGVMECSEHLADLVEAVRGIGVIIVSVGFLIAFAAWRS
jgi:hypothetical protein